MPLGKVDTTLFAERGADVRELVDTTEMYLRTIFELEEEGIVPLRARIAERLEQSGPTVSQTVARMERDGLLHVEEDRSLSLSDEGRSLATAVMRKHRLSERLLTDVIGLEYDKIHDEACRWEHVMSEDVERRLFEVLGKPTTSPFGNPIPGLADLGVLPDDSEANEELNLSDLSRNATHTVTVTQIHESIQSEPELMSKLHTSGICPGESVSVTFIGDSAQLSSAKGVMVLTKDLMHAISVKKEK